jgi:hypothetical protein
LKAVALDVMKRSKLTEKNQNEELTNSTSFSAILFSADRAAVFQISLFTKGSPDESQSLEEEPANTKYEVAVTRLGTGEFQSDFASL